MSEVKTHLIEDYVARREGEENEEDTRARMEAENRLREEGRVEAGEPLPSSFE